SKPTKGNEWQKFTRYGNAFISVVQLWISLADVQRFQYLSGTDLALVG
ncbi:hypothetical protein V3C99_007713, partial [Haemonchus contortus]